jgi:hypothetical protein
MVVASIFQGNQSIPALFSALTNFEINIPNQAGSELNII